MTLSIIILSYNTRQLLLDCLESIFRFTKGFSFEVILVDNASTDGSVEEIKKQRAKRKNTEIVAIFNKRNLGFAKGNNQGIRVAKGKYILLLNSDTVVHQDALLKMVRFLEKDPGVGGVGCRLLNADGTNQASAGSFPTLSVCAEMLFKEHFFSSPKVRGSFNKTREVDWVMGAAIMMKRGVLDEVGFLDENLFMYMEEVELCYRIKKGGYSVFFYPRAKITHLGRGSSETGKKRPILEIYKGLLYFYKKHRSAWEGLILKGMLKLKAALAVLVGFLRQDNYLKETYGEAFFLS